MDGGHDLKAVGNPTDCHTLESILAKKADEIAHSFVQYWNTSAISKVSDARRIYTVVKEGVVERALV